jgi:hypothetical protein
VKPQSDVPSGFFASLETATRSLKVVPIIAPRTNQRTVSNVAMHRRLRRWVRLDHGGRAGGMAWRARCTSISRHAGVKTQPKRSEPKHVGPDLNAIAPNANGQAHHASVRQRAFPLQCSHRITPCDSWESQKRNCKVQAPQAPKPCNLKSIIDPEIDSLSGHYALFADNYDV